MDLGSCSAIRKKKSTEPHVRERKSNATKQFAYNKLKAEHDHKSTKIKPTRPPQPKQTNSDKEGMLIDLSPNDKEEKIRSSQLATQTPTNFSLLDAPIEVPTKHYDFDLAEVEPVVSRLAPPYHYPPTYMNTIGLNECSSDNKSFSTIQQSHQFDLFDASFITDLNRTAKFETLPNNVQNNSSTDSVIKQNNLSGAITKPTILNSALDTLVMDMAASLIPRSSKSISLNTENKYANHTQWMPPTNDLRNSESISDTLRVNLNALDDINNLSTPKKLDRYLYRDLEKEIYKNEACSINMNASQNYDRNNTKENSVSTIPSKIYERQLEVLLPAINKAQTATTKPEKLINTTTKSTNQELCHCNPYDTTINYTRNPTGTSKNNSSTTLYHSAKQSNIETVASESMNDTSSVINQIWFERQAAKDVNICNPRKSFYGNLMQPQTAPTVKNHNFVAIANRPASTIQNDAKSLNTNVYNNVSSNFYSTVAGEFYDTVPANINTASAPYSSILRNNKASFFGNDSQTVPVIYDEVSNDDLLRPHRPAPLAPPLLSSQQILRRLEKERKNQLQQQIQQQQLYGNLAAGTANGIIESQKVQELMLEIDEDATDVEATQALEAVGWDHYKAVRHYKIEKLVR